MVAFLAQLQNELLKRPRVRISKSRINLAVWQNYQLVRKAIDMGPHIYHTPDKDIQDYWEREFPLFLNEITGQKLKNSNFYDYPISREFINTLPVK